MIPNLIDITSKFSAGIIKTCNKYHLHDPLYDCDEVKAMIVVPEGSPDNKALSILMDHLNGEKIVSIFKPKIGTGLGSLDHLPTYLKSPHIDTIMFVIDKDRYSTEEFLKLADQKLIEKGFHRIKKVTEYSFLYQSTRAQLFMVINCCDEVSTDQHTIEDHLLKSGNIPCESDSKTTWNKLNNSEKEGIIQYLSKGGTGVLRSNFPQHYETLDHLKSLI